VVEDEEPIDHRSVISNAIFAFALWTAHFMVAYGAALIFPEQVMARWIAIATLVAAVVALVWRFKKIAEPRPRLAIAAIGISLIAIVFGTFPAFVG
jgi:hypothetical protein